MVVVSGVAVCGPDVVVVVVSTVVVSRGVVGFGVGVAVVVVVAGVTV